MCLFSPLWLERDKSCCETLYFNCYRTACHSLYLDEFATNPCWICYFSLSCCHCTPNIFIFNSSSSSPWPWGTMGSRLLQCCQGERRCQWLYWAPERTPERLDPARCQTLIRSTSAGRARLRSVDLHGWWKIRIIKRKVNGSSSCRAWPQRSGSFRFCRARLALSSKTNWLLALANSLQTKQVHFSHPSKRNKNRKCSVWIMSWNFVLVRAYLCLSVPWANNQWWAESSMSAGLRPASGCCCPKPLHPAASHCSVLTCRGPKQQTAARSSCGCTAGSSGAGRWSLWSPWGTQWSDEWAGGYTRKRVFFLKKRTTSRKGSVGF